MLNVVYKPQKFAFSLHIAAAKRQDSEAAERVDRPHLALFRKRGT